MMAVLHDSVFPQIITKFVLNLIYLVNYENNDRKQR